MYENDIKMRDQLADKVAKQEAKGKNVSEEDKKNLEKYKNNVKRDEINAVKAQNEKMIQDMKNRGATQEEIAARREENAKSEKWVESINR